MDEPFAALDEITRADMRHLLVRLWEGRGATVVFVTHSIAEAVILSDRVLVMTPRPGRITAVEAVTLDRPRRADQEETRRRSTNTWPGSGPALRAGTARDDPPAAALP